MNVPATRPASTVVILRTTDQNPLEVLLVRRSDKVAFMGGAFVFPGGRVDDEDQAHAASIEEPHPPSRFSDLTPREELAFRIAAVREMQEEANVTITISDLVPFAHWVTPEIETKRYDTRFFVARMPAGQLAKPDESEMIDLVWLPPDAAVEKCRSGEILLPPPTWTTLKQIAGCTTVDDTLAWARAKSIVRVQPGWHRRDDETMLTLPGDPLYPTLEGWEIPDDTRFVLTEGKRWKPVRP